MMFFMVSSFSFNSADAPPNITYTPEGGASVGMRAKFFEDAKAAIPDM
ncbi:hypothetical protein [Rhizobium sp. Root483D2]|nr:hypothetical protein [Rhizobium sp. Root483D2]